MVFLNNEGAIEWSESLNRSCKTQLQHRPLLRGLLARSLLSGGAPRVAVGKICTLWWSVLGWRLILYANQWQLSLNHSHHRYFHLRGLMLFCYQGREHTLGHDQQMSSWTSGSPLKSSGVGKSPGSVNGTQTKWHGSTHTLFQPINMVLQKHRRKGRDWIGCLAQVSTGFH